MILHYQGWAQLITRVLKIWEKEAESESQRETGRCYTVGFGDVGRDHKPRDAGDLYKLEKTRGCTLP